MDTKKINSVIAAEVGSPSSLGTACSTGDSHPALSLTNTERLPGVSSHYATEAATATTMTTTSTAGAAGSTRIASSFDPVVGGRSTDGPELDGIGLGINLPPSLQQNPGGVYDYSPSCRNLAAGLNNTSIAASNSSADPFLSSPVAAHPRTATRVADATSEGISQFSPGAMGFLPSIVNPSHMQKNGRLNACSFGSSHDASLDNIIPRTDNLSLGTCHPQDINRLPPSFESNPGFSTRENSSLLSKSSLNQRHLASSSMRTDNSLNEFVSPLTNKTGMVSRLPPASFTSYGSFDRDNRSRCFALEDVPRNLSCLTLAALFDRQEFQSLSSQSPACMDLASLGIVYVSFGDSRDAFAAAQKIQRMHSHWHIRQMTTREYAFATQYQGGNAGLSISDFKGWVVARVSRMVNPATTQGDDLRGLFQSIKSLLEKFGDIKGLHTFYPPAGSCSSSSTTFDSLPSPKSPAVSMSAAGAVSRNIPGCCIWGPPRGGMNGQDGQDYIFEIVAEYFDILSAENATTSLNGNAIYNYYLAIRHYTPDLDGHDPIFSTPVRSPYAPMSPVHEENDARGSIYHTGLNRHDQAPLSPHSQSYAQSPPPFSPVSVSNFREPIPAPKPSGLQAHRSQASPSSFRTANIPPPPTPLSPYTDSSHHFSEQVHLSPTGRSIIPAGDDAVRWNPTRPSTSAPAQSHTQASTLRERDGETCREGSGQRARGQNGQNYVDLDKIRRGLDVRTTIMLRNIPNKIDQTMLKDIVDETSFGKYDFMYLRIDFANNCNVGYAFINFEDPIDITSFAKARAGRSWNCFNSDKVAEISYATIQGKDCLVQKFRNSSVMLEHPSFRPKIFHTGTGPLASSEAPFPQPDNPSKMRRSLENAECIGLFPPRVGAQYRDEMRRRRGIWDRGITVTDRDLERERAMCFQNRAELPELPNDRNGFPAKTGLEAGISEDSRRSHHQTAYASPRLSPSNAYGAPLRSIEGVNSAAGLWQ